MGKNKDDGVLGFLLIVAGALAGWKIVETIRASSPKPQPAPVEYGTCARCKANVRMTAKSCWQCGLRFEDAHVG
jgi:hypothetical protein